jgi:hypothetical protein
VLLLLVGGVGDDAGTAPQVEAPALARAAEGVGVGSHAEVVLEDRRLLVRLRDALLALGGAGGRRRHTVFLREECDGRVLPKE